ncbi:hypothetical protein EKG38_20110 [Shewanella canadensis]|uniref:Uncharacterized protein n=2 Tax=Shewanella TaxID=22 RepID=A0A431W460_9GAMM|nr:MULTISPECIES: hypothetical protein [Shewanella]RTR30172.1 hypothetical protein EKG39_16195 [Shewanella atlantica]RTR37239.1 hypothetical protein EKG38_20110 [Shewanella canadensis]
MAKIAECLDEAVYLVIIESVSGHTLKHLFAGWGLLIYLVDVEKAAAQLDMIKKADRRAAGKIDKKP